MSMNQSERFKRSAQCQELVASYILKRKILLSTKPIREKLIEHLYSFREDMDINDWDFERRMDQAKISIQKIDGCGVFFRLIHRIYVTEKKIFKYQFLSYWYEKPTTSILSIILIILLILNIIAL